MSQTVKVIKTVATEILGLIVLIPSSIAWERDATLIKTSNYSYLATWVLLKAGADANASGQDLLTPLHLAALRGNAHIAQILIDKGANVSAASVSDNTPLHYAALRGNAHIAQILIDKGANVSATDQDLLTPLHLAALQKNAQIAQVLIAHGADVNAKTSYGRTPLHLAASIGNVDMATTFIDLGADVNATDHEGQTPLSYLAGLEKNVDIAQILIEHGADFASILEEGKINNLQFLRQTFVLLAERPHTQSFKQINVFLRGLIEGTKEKPNTSSISRSLLESPMFERNLIWNENSESIFAFLGNTYTYEDREVTADEAIELIDKKLETLNN